MVLDRLAPDQRAVVQLVLGQKRSYDELAGLLGISADAVRSRAVAGVERLAPGDALDAGDRGRITDYLLGQQSPSERDDTRSLLAGHGDARAWARAVARELEAVATSGLPEIPEPPAASEPGPAREPRQPTPDDVARVIRADAPPRAPEESKPDRAPEAPARPVRARPRPRPSDAPAEAGRDSPDAERRRSSLVGGALLLAGIGLAVAALVIFLVNRDDDPGGERAATPTPTATATPDRAQPAATIPLRAVDGGRQSGRMDIYVAQEGQVGFTIEARNVPPTQEGEAYAVWLTGGDRPRRLGFAPSVGQDGRLGTSGPRESDLRRFARWFASARNVVISRETTQDAPEPGEVILRGSIRGGNEG